MSGEIRSNIVPTEIVTAGLRGAAWDSTLLPADMRTAVYRCRTSDGAEVTGYLHSRGGERLVAFIMHPRELLVTHYLVPYLLNQGYAVWVQGSRMVGNDLRLEHELAVHDVAAGMIQLRDCGFDVIVHIGNSGGASLFAFYNQQARATAADRISRTPAGRPTKLEAADLPPADGMIFIAPHPGQGRLLLGMIDPSVIDEEDPLSIDPTLDPFSPANGFRPRSEGGAHYAPDFVARYRAAQTERVERIDAKARQLVKHRVEARKAAQTGSADSFYAAGYTGIFCVWRTDADLRSFDLGMDPSDRTFGSLWGSDPIASNVGSVGFGRVCTPESWLSTWSGLSSNASFDKCGAAIEQPVLMIEYSGDNSVYPDTGDAIFNSIGSADKQRHVVRGNHHGHALKLGEPTGQSVAGSLVTEWLAQKWWA